MRAKPGRKPKLNRETETRLLSLLRAGVPREVACAGVGIDSRTLRIWLTKARGGELKFQAFADKVEAAQAEAQSSMLVQIRKAGAKDWKAIAWMLERVFSERYGYKRKSDETDDTVGDANKTVEIVIRTTSDNQASATVTPPVADAAT